MGYAVGGYAATPYAAGADAAPGASATYADVVLADAPVAFLPLDETSTGAGAANLGTAGGAFEYGSGVTLGKPGLVGGTAASNGTGQRAFVVATNSALGLNAGGVTLECWVLLPDADVMGEFIKVGDVWAGWGVGIGNRESDRPGRELQLEASNVAWQPTGYMLTPGKHHIVVTRDGDLYSWYVDGALVGTRYFRTNSATELLIAGNIDRNSGVSPLDPAIVIDAPAWYATVLSPARIAAHYAAAAAPAAPAAVTVAGGRALEADAAQAGSTTAGQPHGPQPQVVAGGRPAEVDTARPGAVIGTTPGRIAGGRATEASVARAGTTVLAGSVAASTDTANLAAGRARTGGGLNYTEHPVPPRPEHLHLVPMRVLAELLPTPTLKNGRPV